MRTLTDTERWLIDWFNRNSSAGSTEYPDHIPLLTAFMLPDLAKAIDQYMADKDEGPGEGPKSRTYKFSPGATWLGTSIGEMNTDLLRAALLYKIIELRECYNNMTIDQTRFVESRMKEVNIPIKVIS